MKLLGKLVVAAAAVAAVNAYRTDDKFKEEVDKTVDAGKDLLNACLQGLKEGLESTEEKADAPSEPEEKVTDMSECSEPDEEAEEQKQIDIE